MTTELEKSLQNVQMEMNNIKSSIENDRKDRKEFESKITDSIDRVTIAISKVDIYQAEQNNTSNRVDSLDSAIHSNSEQIRDLQIQYASIKNMKDDAKVIKNAVVVLLVAVLVGGALAGYVSSSSPKNNMDAEILEQLKKMNDR